MKIVKITNLAIAADAAGADPDLAAVRRVQEALKASQIGKYMILSRHIDARHKMPLLIYDLVLEADWDGGLSRGMELLSEFPSVAELKMPKPAKDLTHVVVVGTGPAGIFGALALAMSGVKVTVVERGPEVTRRLSDQSEFLKTRVLNPESNLLIGEGGAGTFSDGKLYTRVRDECGAWVLKTMAELCGLPDLTYAKHPHIGSDKLPQLAIGLRQRIMDLGGEFRFDSEVTDIIVEDGICIGVKLKSGETVKGQRVLLAHGLGGRELTLKLIGSGLAHELKKFQLGVRIQHPQKLIDLRQYHLESRPPALGPAEYNLVSSRRDGVGQVSTFCMCPGGHVVMASAWAGQLSSNGMSDRARSGKFANSCLITTFDGTAFESAPAVYEFLSSVERAAFEAGGGDYSLPVQSAKGFIHGYGAIRHEADSAQTGIRPARLDQVLPNELVRAVKAALREFDRKIPGFIDYGQLAGVESCVSSPVRLLRSEYAEASQKGLFVAGEGAGYAGGIMSAALDGIKAVQGMFESYE